MKIVKLISKMKLLIITLFVINSSFVFASDSYDKAEQKIDRIRIAAGDLLDGYYMIGLRLCRYISNSNDGLRCEVVPTSGSYENLTLLREGKVDYAFSISNMAFDSYQGKGQFKTNGPFEDLVQLLKLHDVYFTVLSKDKDQIITFKDLEGKKISNGPPFSDSSKVYNEIFKLYDFKQNPVDVEVLYENYAKRYCAGEIDALMILTGHPSALINIITNKCESDFVSMDRKKLDRFVESNKMFSRKKLKKGSYIGITEDQETVATRAIFVTNKKKNAKITQNFLNYLSVRLQQLKLSDEVLNNLDVSDFLKDFVLPGFNN
ncbi:MAG TPA: TAXI family TRAP transporter solute-binding subunit [Candidatus Megaira endosymbiont of Nemacystus decipiens]|nr:TAXI family TRAP transporter solute-binding subunit [Candidatus Megaera endosymbiont of Nemacystus decipiens]